MKHATRVTSVNVPPDQNVGQLSFEPSATDIDCAAISVYFDKTYIFKSDCIFVIVLLLSLRRHAIKYVIVGCVEGIIVAGSL